MIDGWYDGLYELRDEDWKQLEDKNRRVDDETLKAEWGISEFALGRHGVEAHRARSYEPSANIAGLISGYTGPGSKSLSPNNLYIPTGGKLDVHAIVLARWQGYFLTGPKTIVPNEARVKMDFRLVPWTRVRLLASFAGISTNTAPVTLRFTVRPGLNPRTRYRLRSRWRKP